MSYVVILLVDIYLKRTLKKKNKKTKQKQNAMGIVLFK